MALDLLMVAAGLILLFGGGEALVKGSVSLAQRFGLSALLVSLVIVGFGTSAPELLVSVQAALSGSPDIAIGNVLGSNIANILLIAGTAAVLFPLVLTGPGTRRSATMMVVASLGVAAILFTGTISRLAGLIMFVALVAYLTAAYLSDRKSAEPAAPVDLPTEAEKPLGLPFALLASLGGIALLVAGAWLLVEGATALAEAWGVSEAVIGLTVVAVGTSLPELATTISASRRGASEVVVGNVVGSNIFNLLAILGITAMITPIPVARQFAVVDGPLMAGVALVAALALFAMKRAGRLAGAGLLAAYAAFIGYQVI